MHTIKHTIVRNGSVYYNLRIPPEAFATYNGAKMIRFKLGDLDTSKRHYIDHRELEEVVGRLTPLLFNSFRTGCRLDYKAAAKSFKPRSRLLSDMADEYLQIRDIDPKSTRIALKALVSIAGNRDVADYTREDTRQFLHSYTAARGGAQVKTSTLRKRISSLATVFSYSYAELDIDKRNPFSRVIIPREGYDVSKRGTFTTEQLIEGYVEALASGSTVKLLMPILGETGCRLAEIVGLRVEDVDLEGAELHIRPNDKRRLKTNGSERSLPLVGHALDAVMLIMSKTEEDWLFPQYIKEDGCYATHASNALAKWMKRRWGMTAHSLRHTMRDRLRASEVPLEAIDQLGGWSSVGGVGSRYGQGYSVEHLRQYMDRIAIDTTV